MVQQELGENSSPETNIVRILLVGDPGVGKTSLIHSLVNDEFEPNVPAKMSDITIPAEITPENVPLLIIDYSEREQDNEDFREKVREANVICIVYDASSKDSLDKVATYWLPILRKYQSDEKGIYKPIIVAANKIDLVEEEGSLDKITSVIQEFMEVEAFIEVSALNLKNVVEFFFSAQKAVTYPLAPLFDPQLRVLTKKCRNALIDVFKLCDLDEDDLLSDHELNLFQENCFGTPLQKDALDDLKSIIKQSTMDGIIDNCMTQTGFLFLHTLSIDKGRHEFTWQVLRKFNYDNRLIKIENSNPSDNIVEDLIHTSYSSNSDRSNSELDSIDSSLGLLSIEENENFSNLDFSWLQEHSNIIKAGIGLTIATLLSMLALKYLTHSSARSAA